MKTKSIVRDRELSRSRKRKRAFKAASCDSLLHLQWRIIFGAHQTATVNLTGLIRQPKQSSSLPAQSTVAADRTLCVAESAASSSAFLRTHCVRVKCAPTWLLAGGHSIALISFAKSLLLAQTKTKTIITILIISIVTRTNINNFAIALSLNLTNNYQPINK